MAGNVSKVNMQPLFNNLQLFCDRVDANRALMNGMGYCGMLGGFGGFPGFLSGFGGPIIPINQSGSLFGAVAHIGDGYGAVQSLFNHAMTLSPYSPETKTGGTSAGSSGANTTNNAVSFGDMTESQLKELQDKERTIKARQKQYVDKNTTDEQKKALAKEIESLKAQYEELEAKYANGVSLSETYKGEKFNFYTQLTGSELDKIKELNTAIAKMKENLNKDKEKLQSELSKKSQELAKQGKDGYNPDVLKNAFSEKDQARIEATSKSLENRDKKIETDIKALEEYIKAATTDGAGKTTDYSDWLVKKDMSSSTKTGTTTESTPESETAAAPAPLANNEKLDAKKIENAINDAFPIKEDAPEEEKTKIRKQRTELKNLITKNSSIKTQGKLENYLKSDEFAKAVASYLPDSTDAARDSLGPLKNVYESIMGQDTFDENMGSKKADGYKAKLKKEIAKLDKDENGQIKPIEVKSGTDIDKLSDAQMLYIHSQPGELSDDKKGQILKRFNEIAENLNTDKRLCLDQRPWFPDIIRVYDKNSNDYNHEDVYEIGATGQFTLEDFGRKFGGSDISALNEFVRMLQRIANQ